ncbi:MAG: alpha-L-arabinofuranosidase C-terminal domain-containing protein [Promethearchaeota archaeon]
MINKIKIDLNSNKIYIDPMIYSNFIEHLGDCIHNGIWTYDSVDVPLIKGDPRLVGVREDLLKAVKDMKVKVLRWPGGCYSDVYHWMDAIGPRESRKTVENVHWESFKDRFPGIAPIIENQFGTDEFLTFCEEIKAEPYVNINYGSGTPKEAANWVEYCNGSMQTEYGALRAKNGRIEPYNVKIWGIANEIYGVWEQGYEKNPEDYAQKYLLFAREMRKKDPNIKLVACGYENAKWNQPLLREIGEVYVDYLSIHRYFPYLAGKVTGKKHPENETCYYALMASTTTIKDYINDTWEDIITVLGEDTHVRIAFDEWGVWYLFKDTIKSNYNLQDGIWASSVQMLFQKMTDKCPMANWAQLVNCLGPIQTDKDGLILTPVYLGLKTLVDHCYDYLVTNIEIESETFSSNKFGRIPKLENNLYIDCNVTINEIGNAISISLINKHFSDKLDVEIELTGFVPNDLGLRIELSGESPFDYNTIDNREKVAITKSNITDLKPKFKLELVPHSLTILKLKKK